jgi:hypothetical protein
VQQSFRAELPHCGRCDASGDICPESGSPSLPSLDDLPTLRLMFGLPDRESSPEKVDDDDNNGLERLFWIPPARKAHQVVLGPRFPPQSLPPQASEPVSSSSAPAPTPEPRRSKRTLSIPGQYAILAGRSPWKPRRSRNV